MRHTPNRRPRGGFTLVELLVACALTVLIMAVLATAFQTGLATFSHLKSTVGLSEQLRAAQAIIQRDLEATHLETGDGVALKVSAVGPVAPTRGYFEVVQASALLPMGNPVATPYIAEGTEDGVASHRATDHAVFFTSKLKGNSPQEVFVGLAPPGTPSDPDLIDYLPAGSPPKTVVTAWAELGYFLRPSSVFTVSNDTTAPPLQLFTLHRRQKLLVANAGGQLSSTIAPESSYAARDWWVNYPEASVTTQPAVPAPPSPAFAALNDAASVVTRANRSYLVLNKNMTPAPEYNVEPASGVSLGTDILVTNVVSMQIRLMPGGPPPAGGKFADSLTTPVAAPVPAGSVNGVSYDTSKPNGVQVRAIQIKLRVYDPKNRLTRQTTMTFDL